MAFQALYRRYRPQRFDELKGQGHVAAALRNAVRDDAVAHAYLFSGPRGTGKTSTARILAKALNCEDISAGEPCGVCDSCVAVAAGTSMAVTELDAASNNGVDAIRDLIQRASLGTSGRTKVYIVDEVHMLSAGASNALLKTLEEPPGHVVFVLATTDPHKVLPTIRSRTQHYDFRLLPASLLGDHLRQIASDAGLQVSDAAIDRAVRKGDGSARDALSALDQIVAAGGDGEDDPSVDEIVEGLCERDAGRCLGGVALACGAGADPRTLASAVAAHLRDALLSLMAPELVSLPDVARERVGDQARRLGAPALVRALDAIGAAVLALPNAPDPRVTLEVALVKVSRPETDTSPGAILERLERLERGDRELTTALVHAVPPLAGAAPAAGTSPDPVPPSPTPGKAAPRASGTAGAAGDDRAASGQSGTSKGAAGARRALEATPGRSPERGPAPPAVERTPTLGALRRSSEPAPAVPGEAGAPPPLPGTAELATAWTEAVTPKLSSVSRGRFSTGRFVDVADGAAVLALPNEIMRSKCEERRPELERLLAAHFGRPVPVRLVVDAGVTPTAGAAGAAGGPPPEPDDHIDLDELVDAIDDPRTGIERLAQAFPGAEVIEGT